MEDKNLMENLLWLEKDICDLFIHAAIESSTDHIHQTFKAALNHALSMQDTIYNKMAAKGWYPPEQVEPNKISSVKQKFSTDDMQE